jgi:hypothetical protein
MIAYTRFRQRFRTYCAPGCIGLLLTPRHQLPVAQRERAEQAEKEIKGYPVGNLHVDFTKGLTEEDRQTSLW